VADLSGKIRFQTSIAPWLSVSGSAEAVEFYKSAFGATEAYRLDADGVIARLSIHGAEFWVGEASSEGNSNPEPRSGGPVRMILTVTDPDATFAQARAAGAAEVYPVGDDHGWRIGRVIDPYGIHWEIGHPLPAEK
jgi:PhnB protein